MPHRSSACRYPIAVLEHVIGSESTEDTAERLGLSHRSVTRFRSAGLTHRQADEFACRVGLVAELVWDGWLHDAQPESRADVRRMAKAVAA